MNYLYKICLAFSTSALNLFSDTSLLPLLIANLLCGTRLLTRRWSELQYFVQLFARFFLSCPGLKT